MISSEIDSTISFHHFIVVRLVEYPNQNQSSYDWDFYSKGAGFYLSNPYPPIPSQCYVLASQGNLANSITINLHHQRPA